MLRPSRCLSLLPLALAAGCAHLQYDLSAMPFPVSAAPLRGGGVETRRFTLTDKHVLWVHGLCGESQPDVQGELLANVTPCAGIADFRVTSASSFHDWLVSHLTLGLIRMKTVTVTGVCILPPK